MRKTITKPTSPNVFLNGEISVASYKAMERRVAELEKALATALKALRLKKAA